MSTFSGGADSETLEHSDYFLSLAEIAVALAGFAGLIVAIAGRQDRSGEDARLDVEFLKNVLWASFMAIAFALLPATLLNMGLDPARAFRYSSGAFAVVLPAYAVFHVPRALASYRVSSRRVPASYLLNVALAVASSLGAALCALGFIPPAAYYAALLYLLYAAASSFVRVLLSVARLSA
jgi:hypothetical protein